MVDTLNRPLNRPFGYGAPFPHPPVPQQHDQGFCWSCYHPMYMCVCRTDCIKEPKELLVEPEPYKRGTMAAGLVRNLFTVMQMPAQKAAAQAKEADAKKTVREGDRVIAAMHDLDAAMEETPTQIQVGYGDGVIGGGCCVHLCIEYMPSSALSEVVPLTTLPAMVVVYVLDSEATVLGWGKLVKSGYHIKEGIISTNPGARLIVGVLNAIARVRWCEIFSC